MDRGQSDDGYDHQGNPDQLASKYRVAWLQASEANRQTLCTRLGLRYTHVQDEALLRKVAEGQQALYIRSKQKREKEKEQLAKKPLDLKRRS